MNLHVQHPCKQRRLNRVRTLQAPLNAVKALGGRGDEIRRRPNVRRRVRCAGRTGSGCRQIAWPAPGRAHTPAGARNLGRARKCGGSRVVVFAITQTSTDLGARRAGSTRTARRQTSTAIAPRPLTLRRGVWTLRSGTCSYVNVAQTFPAHAEHENARNEAELGWRVQTTGTVVTDAHSSRPHLQLSGRKGGGCSSPTVHCHRRPQRLRENISHRRPVARSRSTEDGAPADGTRFRGQLS